MRLYIVRHGETVENRQRICQGQTHGTLTPEGIEGAHLVGRALAEVPIDLCFSSDLNRAHDTAKAILQEHHTPYTITTDARLRERYYGAFQGKVFPVTADHYYHPEAEPPMEIAERLRSFMKDIEAHYPDKNILVVTHGFTLRILLALMSELEPDQWSTTPEFANTSLTIVEGPAPYRILKLNDVTHLR